jgi:cyclohexanecarboxylate-CoA ligase
VIAQSDRHPAKLAVMDSGGAYRYDQLVAETLAVAAGLCELGVEPGDVVMVALPPVRQFVPVILAAERIGAIVASVMPSLGRRELDRVIGLAQPSAVVTVAAAGSHRPAVTISDRLARDAAPAPVVVVGASGPRPTAAGHVPVISYETVADRGQATTRRLPDPPGGDALASLAFTTGSSGEAKGVLHTHNTSLLAVRSTAGRQELGEDDVFHAVLPVGHTFGYFYGVRLGLVAGGRVVLQSGWNATEMLTLAREQRITHTAGTPTYLADLLACGDDQSGKLASLRVFTCAGAALDPVLARRAAEFLPGRLSAAYGMSEAGHVASTGPGDDATVAAGMCGRAQPETAIVIERSGGARRSAAGEVVVSGPSVFPGYLQGREFSAQFLPAEGSFRTGDLGYLTEDGSLVLTGRIKNLVIRGGEKIPAGEIEGLLRECPGVGDAAVVGVPDPRMGERCVAVVELAAGSELTLGRVTAFLADRGVTKVFWPEALIAVDRLPRNDVGKWVRSEVSQLAADRLGPAAPGRQEA